MQVQVVEQPGDVFGSITSVWAYVPNVRFASDSDRIAALRSPPG